MNPIVSHEQKARGADPDPAKPVLGPRTSAHAKAPSSCRVAGARKIVIDQLPGFTRKFAALLVAGFPIVSALTALERQSRHPSFRMILGRVRESIEDGAVLSDALRPFAQVFDELYINLIRAGERGGQMAETMARLALMLDASARLRRKVKGAMIYPVVVLCVALLIMTGMIVFIVPVFAEMFTEFGRPLPGPTLVLVRLSEGMKHYLPLIIIALGAGIFFFRKWKATPQGGYLLDSWFLRLPVFGDLLRKLASARFARTLGQLVHSGVPILSALEIAAGATGNKVAARLVLQSRATVERGEPLSAAMANQTAFDPMLLDMLQAGEKTGRVDEMLSFTADYFDDEVNTMLTGLTALLEPVMMLLLGVIIGAIVVCLFLPIFTLADVIK